MARRLRMILPDVAVHVVQRGINRASCFRADADYLVYLSNLRLLSSKHGCAIHAYCLMTNHVHLLLTPRTADACTKMMRDLGQRYVPYFNRKHERTGTLWEGRFRSCLVESARYVLACYRYIELNPVRAKMVEQPASYSWSSHAGNTGARLDPLVSTHAEFDALATNGERRCAAYRELFADEIDEILLAAIRDSTNQGYPLASEAFKDNLSIRSGWKIAPAKPGPRPILGPGPEPGQGFLALTPN